MRTERTRFLLTIVAVAALLWAQLGTLVHLGALEHRYCQEHRAIEHGAAATDCPSTAPQAPEHPSDDSSEEEDHHGCDLVLLHADKGWSSGTQPVTSYRTVPDATSAESCAPRLFPPSIALLRVSPKTSPPTHS